MSLANKILLVVIALASIGMFYMGARTLRMHQNWRDQAQQSDQQFEQLQNEREKLINGTGDRSGIRQLQVAVARLLVDRSRAWFKCDAKVSPNPADGSVTVTVTTDQPAHGITQDTTLYAFDEADVQNGGRYLGEFKVTQSDQAKKQVVLTPTTSRLEPAEMNRLTEAKRPWVLYEVLPYDNREVMASLSDEEKKAVPFDLSQPVRDYGVLFNAAAAEKTLLNDRILALTGDNSLLDAALASAKRQEEAVKGDVATAAVDLKTMQGEREAVAAYHTQIEQEFEATKAAIAELVKANKAMAGQIAVLQVEAVRRIDQRSRAMARSNAGGQ